MSSDSTVTQLADGVQKDGPRLATEAPALTNLDWLPEGAGWPELDDLAADHRRLLAQLSEVATERSALRERFEEEDRVHGEALSAAYRGGGDPDAIPDVTPPDERRAALAAVERRRRAAVDALDGFLSDAIGRLETEAVGWLGDLASRRESAAEQRREAERLLAEARAEEVRAARLEEWVTRNAGLHQRAGFRNIPNFRYVTWVGMQEFTPPPEPEEDGMGGYRPQLVDPPSREPWDAERVARAAAVMEKPKRRIVRRVISEEES